MRDGNQYNTKDTAGFIQTDPDKGGPENAGKSGKAVAKPKSGGYAKTNAKYWEQKVFKPIYVKNGERKEAKHYAARIGYQRDRHTFPLGTGNKGSAGKEAVKIYDFLRLNGWEATREKYAPSYVPKSDKPVTVGEYIEEASALAKAAPGTIAAYASSLRSIVSSISGVSSEITVNRNRRVKDKKTGKMVFKELAETKDLRFDYVSKEAKAWREKVNSVPLEVMTPAKVIKWQKAYVDDRAGTDHESRRKAENSANSILRQAKGLFSKKIIPNIESLRLPEKLPFEGVPMLKRKPSRYVSKIEKELGGVGKLIGDAVKELAETEPESFKIFILALMAGLRGGEIDSLLWEQINLNEREISIQVTPYFKPKTDESIGEVEIDPETAETLRGFRARAEGIFVIQSEREFNANRRSRERRAKKEFATLSKWLKSKGITAQKPIHELRKEFGNQICQKEGLFAASRALRHADPSITAAYYTDEKEGVTVGLGGFLTGNKKSNVTPIEEGREEAV